MGGGGQHHVGVAGGVGHHLLMHHREQIVAQQPLSHRPLVQVHERRVGPLHDEYLNAILGIVRVEYVRQMILRHRPSRCGCG